MCSHQYYDMWLVRAVVGIGANWLKLESNESNGTNLGTF